MHDSARVAVVRRGEWLSWATVAYNSLEGLIALGAGLMAGSVALVGFGFDSVLEVTSGATALWRLRVDHDPARRARAERRALQIIGWCFVLLAVYVTAEAAARLVRREPPQESLIGIVLAAVSVVIMPVLARAKRRVAAGLSSAALTADATQTQLCMFLSAILLVGLSLNAVAGWWWADPLAGLAMVPIMAKEGVDAIRGKTCCATCHA